MINIVIFSKDRACQLELCIRTVIEKLHIPFKIYVQYITSSSLFEDGYIKLIQSHTDIIFIKEKYVKQTLICLLQSLQNKHVLFLTDDDVFINDVTQTEFDTVFTKYEMDINIHSLSFRMNPTIDYCYPAKKHMKKPDCFLEQEKYLVWDWTKCELHMCWGYPMAINSHLYRIHEILPIIERNEFKNINELEARINSNRFRNKPLLLSFTESKLFNIQNNFVKEFNNHNDVSLSQYNVNTLNNKFLNDYIISTENIYGIKRNMAHGQLDYIFVRK
jgi:hypothetical protein